MTKEGRASVLLTDKSNECLILALSFPFGCWTFVETFVELRESRQRSL